MELKMTKKDNSTPYQSELYDNHVVDTLPYYESYHQETINLIKALSLKVELWLDTGCGTGSLVKNAIPEFPDTEFLLLDPSEAMLQQAQLKLTQKNSKKLKFLKPDPTQNFSQKLDKKPDIITAIQCHHYLSPEDRIKAVQVCYDLLNEDGAFVTFENIRPLTSQGIDIGKEYWKNFQLSCGKDIGEIDQHLARFDQEYFPITLEEHLSLLRNAGFKTVEVLWYSYLQAGFYCIK
jgi:tRNA (cmo5U34)-methyltransferase